jgi:phosphoglycolate phosphatase-like HAD superfamily hydrolase
MTMQRRSSLPRRRAFVGGALVCALSLLGTGCATTHVDRAPTDLSSAHELPSWAPGGARDAIVRFVESTTRPGSANYVAASDRIAVFDNDGTLWAEKPVYVQLLFAIDRVRELAPAHPEWTTTEPFAAIVRGDDAALAALSEHDVAAIIAATHSGMTPEEFREIVRTWITTHANPATGKPYLEMAYGPMLEVLAYLRTHGYRTFIVSGGGADFVRAFAETLYGIPPDQVIGSTDELVLETRDGVPTLIKTGKLDFLDDRSGKPIGIERHIGIRPRMAFGNSDGDLAMLEWTMAGSPPRFAAIVHHTDADREFAYDRESSVGRLDKALDVAASRGWLVIDMRRDWKSIY